MLENGLLICYIFSMVVLILALVNWIEKNNSFQRFP